MSSFFATYSRHIFNIYKWSSNKHQTTVELEGKKLNTYSLIDFDRRCQCIKLTRFSSDQWLFY